MQIKGIYFKISFWSNIFQLHLKSTFYSWIFKIVYTSNHVLCYSNTPIRTISHGLTHKQAPPRIIWFLVLPWNDDTAAAAALCVCVCVCVCMYVCACVYFLGFSWLNKSINVMPDTQVSDGMLRKYFGVKYLCRHVIDNHSRNLQASNGSQECQLNQGRPQDVKDNSYKLSKL